MKTARRGRVVGSGGGDERAQRARARVRTLRAQLVSSRAHSSPRHARCLVASAAMRDGPPRSRVCSTRHDALKRGLV